MSKVSKRRLAKIRFWASRVKYGRSTIDEVPEWYREEVRAFMETNDYFFIIGGVK